MNIVNFGDSFKIYTDTLRVYQKLPAGAYKIRYSEMEGFFLIAAAALTSREEKVYGDLVKKADKVLTSFQKTEKNLGVMLSGEKGIGKSLFLNILSEKAVEKELPTIIIDTPYPGLANYIASIQQEALFVFDEFEKIFPNSNSNEVENQSRFLTLFDGTSPSKHLYAISVNNIYKVNEFMLNRPGRFHYHLRFNFLEEKEIREYLEDKLEQKYYGEIKKVISFGRKIPLNYDYLSAISFELNFGYSFEEAIKDLNILNLGDEVYSIEVFFVGEKETLLLEKRVSLFDSIIVLSGYDDDDSFFNIKFKSDDIEYRDNILYCSGEKVSYKIVSGEKKEERRRSVEKIILRAKNKMDTYRFTI